MLSRNTLKLIYNALFLSHLNYGITAWGFHSCSRFIKLQKRAVRIISNSKYNAHTSILFKQLGLLKLTDLFNLSCIKFYYKFKNNSLPNYFVNLFPTTRQLQHLERPRRIVHTPRRYDETIHDIPMLTPSMPILLTNTKNNRLCIRHKVPKLINENYLPDIVMNKISTHCYTGFIQYAKNYIIDNYEAKCNIANCYICNPT